MRAEAIAPVNQRDFRRDVAQLVRPVERRVAATDDHDPAIAKFLRIRHDLVHAATIPRLGTGLRKPAWRERPDAAGNDHRARGEAVTLGRQHEMPILLGEPDHPLSEKRPRAELARLRGELDHQVLRENLREATDVEDVLLGIQRFQLSAELGQRVDDARGGAAHAGVELGEQSRRPAADDGEVCDLVSYVRGVGGHGLEE